MELTTSPDGAGAKVLSEVIRTFNHVPTSDLEPGSVEVRFLSWHIMKLVTLKAVGLRATFNWNTLHIELLWLSEECRGSGIGQQIIMAAEERVIELSCLNAFVEMTSW